MNKKLKSTLSKLNFYLGRNPKTENIINWKDYIPKPYHAIVTITADFELAWSWRYSKQFKDPYTEAISHAKLERKNIPPILKLCDQYNIPITWATVGHLFIDKCKRINGKAHENILQSQPYENKYWKFSGKDWFEYDPCTNFNESPEWYAPDLIKLILDSKTKHEIGCHTFSHIDCRDEVCPGEVFNSELQACVNLANKEGLTLKSFVHPGHTIGNLDNLSRWGFSSYQTDPGNILGYPVRHSNGLIELKRTYELAYRNGWTIKYHRYRYKKIIDRAIKNKAYCNFWFHPSFDPLFLNEVLPEIFSYLNDNRDKIWVTTVCDYTKYLNLQRVTT